MIITKIRFWWKVAVPQLVEWSLPTPEVRSSNPVIGKIYIEKTKKRKKAGNGHFLKKSELGA